MRWEEHVARMEEMRKRTKFAMQNPTGSDHLGDMATGMRTS